MLIHTPSLFDDDDDDGGEWHNHSSFSPNFGVPLLS